MKQIICEMCGGKEIIKQEGVFVCQGCGCKYTIEEARKMMVDVPESTSLSNVDDQSHTVTVQQNVPDAGRVDVSGSTVKVDHSDRLKNLYQLARRARGDENSANAAKYYEMILIEDPGSWEAAFFTVYFKAMECTIAQIESAAISVNNCIDSVLTLIQQNVPTHEEQVAAYTEVANRVMSISNLFYNAATNNYNDIDSEIRHSFTQQFLDNSFGALRTCYYLGDCLQRFYGRDGAAQKLAVEAWLTGINIHKSVVKFLQDKDGNVREIERYADKVRRYMPDYVTPEIVTSSGGCYVATCVYGSYDCPQVWTLRRYRDNTLARTWYGRAFIRTYYAISPTLVRWFGRMQWFRNLWKPCLDNMVSRLNAEGFDNTPYEDRKW